MGGLKGSFTLLYLSSVRSGADLGGPGSALLRLACPSSCSSQLGPVETTEDLRTHSAGGYA